MRSIVAAGVLQLLSLLLAVTPAGGQDLNPYGRIDPFDASLSVLRRSLGPGGTPAVLGSLVEADPPAIDRLLEEMLAHPDAAMRTAAAVRLADREAADPRRLVARLGDDDDARAAFVVALAGDDRLDADTAATFLDGDLAGDSPVAIAILAARAARPADATRLRTIATDETAPPLARGIAAGVLESTTPGSVSIWFDALDAVPATAADAAVFGTATTLETLGAVAGLRALETRTEGRAADDAIRAAIVLALLRLDPESGGRAWRAIARSSDRDRVIPNAMLLVSAGRPLPPDAAATLPNDDPLQTAVRSLIVAAPPTRTTAAIDAVRQGHLPTIRWLLDLPEDEVPIEVVEAMIDSALAHRRNAMVEVLLLASRRLAAVDPAAAGRRLQAAVDGDDEIVREAMLRGLVAAGGPAAAEAARPLLSAADRRTRSLALLAVVRGAGDGTIDGQSIKRLGRAAAGGGDLPDDLRPLAAWHHLLLEKRLDDALPGILGG